jgi:uncharacterized protein YacL (UPF0231 family)
MSWEEKALNWLNKEKQKDNTELDKSKQDFINQIKGMKREDLFVKPKKTLWMRIKKMIWGI